MTTASHAPSTAPTDTSTGATGLALAALAGGLVAVALGLYGRVHTPTGQPITTFGFASVIDAKAWLATGAAALAVAQAASAAWMWGRLPGAGRAPAWIPTAHRWTGTVAFVLTLPVAYHCLWSLGAQTTTLRVAIHSLLGCLFYGVFAAKMLLLRVDRLPARVLPLAGGALVVGLVALWVSSALWFFTIGSRPL